MKIKEIREHNIGYKSDRTKYLEEEEQTLTYENLKVKIQSMNSYMHSY